MPPPELVSSLFGGLALLVGALATFTASRSKRIGEDQRFRKRELRRYRDRDEVLVAYVYRMRRELAERGLPIPALPKILEDDDEHDVPSVAPASPASPGGAPGAAG